VIRFAVHVRLVQSLAWLRHALRFASLGLLTLCVLGSSACGDSAQLVSTQVTARIYIEGALRPQMSELRVRSYRGTKGRFVLRSDRAYPLPELGDVLDVSFVPRDGDGEGSVLVVADALSRQGQVLVEARAAFAFVQREQRLFELWLYRCGDMALGTLCAEPECADQTCLTCVLDRCSATPLYAKPQLVMFDPALAADPEKPPPGHSAQSTPAGSDARDGAASDTSVAPDLLDAELADGQPADGGVAGERCGDESCDAAQADAASDPERDADAFDAGLPDAGAPDASMVSPEDAAIDAGSDAEEPPGRCAQDSAWTTSQANATIPALSRSLAQHSNATGTLAQYLCRVRTPTGTVLAPGKASGSATNPTRFDHGCYSTYYGPVAGRPGTQAWQSFDSETTGVDFQVLTPSAECQLDWVSVSAGQALPARALPIGNTGGATPQPLYACRVSVTDATTSGTHIGRLGSALGELCHVQYYQQAPLERSQFEVLVQTRP
jgi:hypothetical protein